MIGAINSLQNVPCPPTTRTQDLFLLVDAFAGKTDSCIAAVNTMIKNLVPELIRIQDNWDINIRLRILHFGTGAEWTTSNMQEVSDYCHVDIIASGLCDLGAAYCKLNEQLEYNHRIWGNYQRRYAPVIALFLHRKPTDDYVTIFEKLSQNSEFRNARKLAFIIGNVPNMSFIEQFTGHRNLVFSMEEKSILLRVITPEGDERRHIYDEILEE